MLQFQRPRRRRQIPLNAPEASIPLIVDSINTSQENAAEDIELLATAGLDATVGGAIFQDLESEIPRFDLEEGVADREGYFG